MVGYRASREDAVTHAEETKLIENARVRVTRWRLPPGGATGHHRHAFDYIVVPLTAAEIEIHVPDGRVSQATLELGVPYFRNAGVEHDVRNPNDREIEFIEIELLDLGR